MSYPKQERGVEFIESVKSLPMKKGAPEANKTAIGTDRSYIFHPYGKRTTSDADVY
jgi:hypothetical protein